MRTRRAAPMLGVIVVLTLAATPTGDLSAQKPVPLDTLHATASRAVAGAAAHTRSVDVLRRTDIEALPARSVADVLARALGVDLLARSAAQADVAIRGASFEQVLVMIDGVPVNDDQTGHFHLDVAVPLDGIERIEILRGPASALYGSAAVGGVVNIVTRRGVREVSARAQGGSFGAVGGGIEVGTVVGPVSARLGVDHDRADGHRDGTEHRTTQSRLSLDAPAANGTVRGDVAYALRDFGAAHFYAPFDSREKTRTATAAIAWTRTGDRLSVTPRLSLRQHEDDFILRREDPSFYRNTHTNRSATAEVVARLTISEEWHAAIGSEVVRSALDSNALGERTEHRAAVFGELAAGSVASVLVTSGLRLDHHTAFGTRLSPSVAAAWHVASRVRLRASGATGFRAPSWTDRYYEDPANIGSPELKPERFRTGEVGIALETGARTRVDLAAFIRRAHDLIDWGRPADSGDEVAWRTLNIEEATFRGVEATVEVRAALLALTARTSLLSFDAAEEAGFTSKYALQPLTRSFSIEANRPAGLLRPAVRISHARRADGSDWTLLDLRAAVDAAGLQLFVDATNALDAEYPDVSDQPAPGRAFHLGIRLRR